MSSIRLLVNPDKLPKPPATATKSFQRNQVTKETAIMLKDYFYSAKMKAINRSIKRSGKI